MPTSLRLRVSVLYDYACLVAATATATTFFVAFVVMVAATAAAIMPAEELLDLLGRSIVDVLDSADEVEVFACQRVVEVEYDDFVLDLEDATTDDLPVGRVQGQRSTFDDQSIELAFAVDEDLTGQLLDGFVGRLTVGNLRTKSNLSPALRPKSCFSKAGSIIPIPWMYSRGRSGVVCSIRIRSFSSPTYSS